MKTSDAKAEGPILWPPDVKSQLTGKAPDAGKDWGQEEKGRQRTRWLDDIIDSMDMSLSRLWETVKDREAWCVTIHGVTKKQTELDNWRTIVLQARHLSLRCQQNWFPLRAMRKNASNSSWLAIFFVSSLCAYFCLQISPFYKDISHIGWWHCCCCC